MGAWSVSITGNDTAQDLQKEYRVAFWKFEISEALRKLDQFVRRDFDESDEEEWANYYYSLADYMWKKGILTDDVRDKAIAMIDSGFGLEIWAESGEKILRSREKALAAFREKLRSPMPPKKKIKPNICARRIFQDGDVIAIELQTAGKPYTANREKKMTEEEFHAADGKFVLVQLMGCRASWTSCLDPEVKDYWADFRLFDGLYDTVPTSVDVRQLKPASLHAYRRMTSFFTCESSMFYFKRRKAQVIGNDAAYAAEQTVDPNPALVFFGVNRPWSNPDSDLLAAMGK